MQIRNKIINNFKNFLNNLKSIFYSGNVEYYYLWLFISWILFLLFIYFRFLRERLPQDIPFMLTEWRFWVLLYICCIYLYIIKSIFFPKQPLHIFQSFRNIFDKIFVIFDTSIKYNKYFYPHYVKLFCNLGPILGNWTKKQDILFYLFGDIIPRIFLVFVFIGDIFWFHKLYYFYIIIFFGIFPWFYSYHRYSMYHAKELGLTYLESLYTWVNVHEKGWDEPTVQYEYDEDDILREIPIVPEWKPHPRNKYHEKMVTIREYLQILLEKDIDYVMNDYANDDDYDFDSSTLSKEYRYKQYEEIMGKTELNAADYEILNKEFKTIMPILSDLAFTLYYLPDKEKRYHMPKINLAIYILWFIGWSYILITSFHTLKGFSGTIEFLNLFLYYLREFMQL